MTSSSQILKVGVVGVGNMGRNHLRVLSNMSQYELVGCFDSDKVLSQQCAQKYDIKPFDDVEELFESVDVAHIVAPSFLHADLSIKAARAGCHVLVEKPIALKIDDAERIIQAAKDANVKLCVGHVERFNPAISSLMSIVESEELISADFRRMSSYDGRINDTSVVLDLMIHDIDVMNAIFNEPIKSVSAQGSSVYSDRIDYAQAMITHSSGKTVSLTASRITESKIRKAQFNAKNAFIDVDYLVRTVEISRKTNFDLDVGYPVQYTQENIIEKIFVPMIEPLRAEFDHFYEAIVHDVPLRPSGEMGKCALEICLHIEDLIEKEWAKQ